MDHRLDRALKRFARSDRSVGLDGELEAIEIGAIPYAHVLNFIVGAANRRKDRIKSNGTDLDPLFLVSFLRDESEAAFCTKLELKSGLTGDFRDVLLGIEDLHLAGEFQICRSDVFGAFYGESDRLGLISKELETDLADIEQDSNHVFLYALYSREFMGYTRDLHMRNSSTRKRGVDDTAKR